MFRYLMWLWCPVAFHGIVHGQESYRLELKPFDFQTGRAESHFSGIGQIESNGTHFYLRGFRETEILILDEAAAVVGKIGGKGGHPAEFGQEGVTAISTRDNELWGIDMELKRVRRFVDGAYRESFRLDSFNISHEAGLANSFAFSDQFVVIPAHAETKRRLAAVYLHDGTLVDHIGEIVELAGLSKRIVGINDTHWLAMDDGWVSVHKFFPLVTIYDESFSMVDQFQVNSAVTGDMVDKTMSFDPGDQYTLPAPVFADVKIFRDDLYLMCKGFLHQVDLKSHKVKSITSFYGRGEDFKHVDQPQLTLHYFAFLDNGFFVVGHPAMLWNHDLWTTELPFLATGPG